MVTTLVGAPTVTVRLFASVADAAGTRSVTLAARTAGAALALLGARASAPRDFRRILATCTLLVGDARVDAGHVLEEGDELAVLPPFSGGAR